MAGIFSDKALGSQFGDRVVWFVISSVDYIGQIISGKSVLGTSLRKRADQIDYIIINLTMDSSLVRAVIRPAFIVKSLQAWPLTCATIVLLSHDLTITPALTGGELPLD